MRAFVLGVASLCWLGCGEDEAVVADAAAVDAAVGDAAAEVDAPDVDAAEVDAAQLDAPEVDAPEIDAPEIDAPEIDAPESDAPEIDAPEIDAPEIDAPEIDAPEVDAAVDAPVDAAPITGTSCAAIHAAVPAAPDGIYAIDPDGGGAGAAFDTYCDMTTDGGGWTLVSYGYRQAGNTAPYYLPDAAQGTWTPGARDNVAAVDARALLAASTQVALTVTGTALVTGNVNAYARSYAWDIPSPQSAVMSLADPSSTGCRTVSVRDLHTATAFDAMVLDVKPLQVQCSGHKNGTPYERQLVGFNSGSCAGVCGLDPVTSMGMVVWYGTGYSPTTSGGAGSPERPASFALWFR